MHTTWYASAPPLNLPVTQVSGVCFNQSGRLLVLEDDAGRFFLAGGKPERGETWQQTLRREVWEEAQAQLSAVRLLGFQRVEGDPAWFGGAPYAQLRCSARISWLAPSAPDPATGQSFQRHFVTPQAALEKLPWLAEALAAAVKKDM